MNLDILSDLIITKVYSATTMYTEKNAKVKRSNRSKWAIVIKYEGKTMYVKFGKQSVITIIISSVSLVAAIVIFVILNNK